MAECERCEPRDEPLTLDPHDWDGMRTLGHRMVDELIEFTRTVRERRVWQPMPESAKRAIERDLPLAGVGAEQAYREFAEHVLPYPWGNIHPRFWGWVVGSGSPFGMLSEMATAAMNTNASFGEQSAIYIERQVVEWFRQLFGYPESSSGILMSGGSMANLIGLAVARHTATDGRVKEHGVEALERPLRVYGSSETHSSVVKALQLLGLGGRAFVPVAVRADFAIDVDALRQQIAADRAAGMQPICVVGNAGTVNTGAFDDLSALANLCAEEKLWLHVDGAFGALAVLCPKLRPLVKGMERSDSLAFDLHKWLHVPYDVGGVLVRDAAQHHATFSSDASYLAEVRGGINEGPQAYNQLGPELSRGFRGLKAWMTIREQGFEKLGKLVKQNVDQAAYLAALIERDDALQLVAPVPLNVVCFRYVHADAAEDSLNALNVELLNRLQRSGKALPSHTMIDGRFVLRVAITNHRSRDEDFELLVSEVVKLGRVLVGHETDPT